jgi:hypothetical protein
MPQTETIFYRHHGKSVVAVVVVVVMVAGWLTG